jgi:hypothetical protein
MKFGRLAQEAICFKHRKSSYLKVKMRDAHGMDFEDLNKSISS